MGNRQGSVRLPKLEHTKPGTFSAHGIGSWEDGDTTGVLQLDDALKVSRCKFMKIDVEGMEANVIRGARDVIRRCRPVLNVENDRREKLLELIRMLQEMDYCLCWHLPPFSNPENYFREPDNEFWGLISINMLCHPVGLTLPRADIYRILSPDNWWSDIPGGCDGALGQKYPEYGSAPPMNARPTILLSTFQPLQPGGHLLQRG